MMALLVVIAVMNGFDKELEEKILGINSDLLVKSEPFISEDKSLLEKISQLDEVVSVSPVVLGNASFISQNTIANVYIKGIELREESRTTRIQKYLLNKLEEIPPQGIVVGKVLADKFNLALGSRIEILVPFGLETFPFEVEGIFESGMYEYDLSLVYINLKRAQEIFALPGITALELKLKDPYRAELVKRKVEEILGSEYQILSWMDLNKSLFQALKLEKTAMFVILCLIVLVASFNIASILIMFVLEKVKDIGILRAIGMQKKCVQRLFIFQGMMIGTAGIFLGAIAGGILIYILKNYPIVKLPSDIYYIDKLPVRPDILDFLLIIFSAILITFISTLYPAVKAGKFEPAVALRYE